MMDIENSNPLAIHKNQTKEPLIKSTQQIFTENK